MRVLIQQRSRYSYPQPAALGPQVIRLRPADHARARIESYRLDVAPENRVHWQRDPHGNRVARVTFKTGQLVRDLEIVVELAVDVRPVNPFDFFVDDRAKQIPFAYHDGLADELTPFFDTGDAAYHMGRLASEFSGSLPATGEIIGLLVRLNQAVHDRVAYVIRDEPGVWTPEETLANGRGSCRDVAVLLVALLRARGIAARFASGYLVQLTDEGMIPNEPKGVTRDVVDLHAWAEVFIPGAGWVGLDATSGLFTGEGHIPLACTASPKTAAPLEGTSSEAATGAAFATTISRLGHETRPTAPYSDDVWRELQDAGDRVDGALRAAGLDVWIGGEPTFTARERQDAEEWQGAALGADKWRRGQELATTLRDRIAPGGVVLHRMGKHYPGESLPRWALDVIARRDRKPLWPAHSFADTDSIDAARHVGEGLAAALGIPAELHEAYEDPWEVLRAEAALPPELDPRKSGLDDPEERRRLAKILDHGVGGVVGWVLPLGRGRTGWVTDRWEFRRHDLFLLPGDSPIGLRLPLGSLAAGAAPPLWADAPDLPDPRRDDDDTQAVHTRRPAASKAPQPGDPGVRVRTALAIEPRDGQLWVFLPPMPRFDDFARSSRRSKPCERARPSKSTSRATRRRRRSR